MKSKEYQELVKRKGRSKYHNKPCYVDGLFFQSKKEATQYSILKLRLRDGEIRDLKCQVTFLLEVNGILICKYRADFVYEEVASYRQIIEDVKGYRTDLYKLKKKLMYALYGIEIQEV